jgi:hypothetical protein
LHVDNLIDKISESVLTRLGLIWCNVVIVLANAMLESVGKCIGKQRSVCNLLVRRGQSRPLESCLFYGSMEVKHNGIMGILNI